LYWDDKINELEKYFMNMKLPAYIRLDEWTIIENVENFVKVHLIILKRYNGNNNFMPYMERLYLLKRVLENLNNVDNRNC